MVAFIRTNGGRIVIAAFLLLAAAAASLTLSACTSEDGAATSSTSRGPSSTAASTSSSQNGSDGSAGGTSSTTVPGSPADEEDLAFDVVATGLEVPWEIRVLPEGDLLVTEREGRIVRVDVAAGSITEVGRLNVDAMGEGGLMGLALDPDYPRSPHVYVAYTHSADGELRNRISRLTIASDTIREEQVLLDGIPAGSIHNGSRLAFGPDGNLWATTGDAGDGDNSQDLASLGGKVLRIRPDGSVPADNPFPGSPVYTYGHRNPQGLDWNPATGQAFVTEHGPAQDDEINALSAGDNYGWPEETGAPAGSEFHGSIESWTPTIAPAGAAFYNRTEIRGWQGSLLFVTLKEQDLRRLSPANEGFSQVGSEQILFDEEFGRLRAIAVAPDGSLYVGTSNRDGRGDAGPDDDRILRIRPR